MHSCQINKSFLILLIGGGLVFHQTAFSANDFPPTLPRATSAAKMGNRDFAYMQYRAVQRNAKLKKYRPAALFALGEYNYSMALFDESVEYFTEFLNEDTSFLGTLFACAYLLKLHRRNSELDEMKMLEKKILTLKQHSFVFREAVAYSLSSPLQKKMRAVFTINKVEFFIEDSLFEQISY